MKPNMGGMAERPKASGKETQEQRHVSSILTPAQILKKKEKNGNFI